MQLINRVTLEDGETLDSIYPIGQPIKTIGGETVTAREHRRLEPKAKYEGSVRRGLTRVQYYQWEVWGDIEAEQP
jgi:hypothetical protein